MNKTNIRIRNTQHITTKPPKPEDAELTKPTPAQGPCDSCGNPIVPDKPIPNTNRPKRKTDKQEELIYTNGVQKEDNIVSIKINPDSTNFLRTGKNGLSALYLSNKLECILKSIKRLNAGIEQLKEEVQPAVIGEKIVEIDKEFEMNSDGTVNLKLGNGLERDSLNYIQPKLDEGTLGISEDGKIMTIWCEYNPGENE